MSVLRKNLRRALLAALWLGTGCDGCRGEKPYTPFGVTSALPSKPSSSPVASVSASPSAREPELNLRKALLSPPLARRWSVEGRELESPPNRVFEQALSLPGIGAEPARILAWTLPAPDAGAEQPGELWLYAPNAESKKLLEFPAFLPTGESCRYATTLGATRAQLVSLDVTATCATPLVARSPTRALAIIDPDASRPLRFGVRASDPAAGETLKLVLDARDEDADGRDDFRLAAELSVGSSAAVSANLIWLDRAAGISRDGREPARGLYEFLGKDTVRAQRKKTAAAALEDVSSARRLLATLCAEGGTARVFDWDGAPLRCGSLQSVIDRLGSLEVAAHLAENDVAAALGALSRDGWYFAALGTKQRAALVKDIEKKLTAVAAARIAIGVRPRARKALDRSPLAFDANGALLIQTESGLYRLDPAGAREEPLQADAGVEAWPLEAPGPGGAPVLGVSYSCDRSELGLLAANGSVEVTSLLAPRPGACGGRRFDDAFNPVPVSSDGGFSALIGGALLVVDGQPRPSSSRGSPRSPDGAWLAVPTALGLLVDGARHELFRIAAWSLPSMSGCVVANGGERAACLRAGRAELYLKSTAAP